MIWIDSRIGSKDLLKPLLDAGVPAEMTTLAFGDIAFTGKGIGGASIDIGIELKTIGDLVGSIRSGRLAGHQLPGLTETYDYRWLLVEGTWRHDDNGMIVTYQGKSRGWRPLPGKMSASELEKHVFTFECCGGLHTRYTNSRRDTIRFLSCLYRWWTDTPLDQHTSHLVAHNPPTIVPLSKFRQAVIKWPNIGLRISKTVESAFKGSIRKAAAAPVTTWAELATKTDKGQLRRLGMKAAREIDEFLDGETN